MSFQLAAAYVQLSQRGFGTVMGGVDQIRGKLGGLVSYVTGPVAAGMAAIGTGASVAGMVGLAAKVEQTTAQFKTLLGSVDAARGMIESLQKFSASTPFQFDGLAASAKQLLAFGVANDQIIPTLRVLGDVAAATGNDVGELASIYGKVKANGRLMTEALDQFNDRGIPVGKALEEAFGKTGEEIRKMASAGQISFSDLQTAMVSMSSQGGIAFNGMAEQSTTLGGLWSTLKDNVSLLMGDIGTSIVEGFDLKSVVGNLTQFVQQVQGVYLPGIVSAFHWVGSEIVTPFFGAIGSMTTAMIDFVADIDLYWQYAYTSIGNQINNIWQVVSTFFQNAVTMGGWFVGNVGTFFVNLYNNAGRIFGNMVEQMKNVWNGLWDFISGRGFSIDFTPMVDSFNAALQGIEMPNLAEAQQDALRTDLDRIAGEMASRQAARQKRRSDMERQGNDNAIAALEVQESGEKRITEEKEKQRSASIMGVAELANRMQEAVLFRASNQGKGAGGAGAFVQNAPVGNVGSSMRQDVDFLKQAVQHLSTIASLANGQGLRVINQVGGGGVNIPAASVQFGVTGNG